MWLPSPIPCLCLSPESGHGHCVCHFWIHHSGPRCGLGRLCSLVRMRRMFGYEDRQVTRRVSSLFQARLRLLPLLSAFMRLCRLIIRPSALTDSVKVCSCMRDHNYLKPCTDADIITRTIFPLADNRSGVYSAYRLTLTSNSASLFPSFVNRRCY